MLYLASASPRRRLLLQKLTREFETLAPDIEERRADNEDPEAYVVRLALEKAHAARQPGLQPWPLLAADTEVVLDDEVLGKPGTSEEAMRMLTALSGRSHEVYSAVALLHEGEQVLVNRNRVLFREISEAECRAYCETGEPLDKAGAYGIQGRAANFIARLDGSFSGVMGLPLAETARLLDGLRN